ncbi:MAG: extracellular solute-binding protein, partial [Firmicutes bacterium]|nr:extracellular solute-binding protein [Bacillota bacterium]
MFERLSGILRRFLLTALFLLIVAGALGALFSVLVLHLPPLKIFDWLIRGREAPLFYRTELPKDERFRITLWEYDYPVPYGVSPYRSYLEEALDAFNELYPNIEVEVQFLRPGEGQAKLRRALAEGYPPDVYSTWWEEPPAVYPFQVPVTPYLLEGERGSYSETGWLASARGQKGKEILWAWPRWLFVRAMMANRNLLDTAEVKIEELADGWTLDDMATLADRIFDLEKTAFGGAAPVVLAVNPGGGSFHRELTLAAGVPSLLDPVNGELAWKPADAEALGLWLEGMSAKRSLSPQVGAARRSAAPRRFPDPQDTKGLPAPQTLTQFLAGRAVLLGGVNPALAHYL